MYCVFRIKLPRHGMENTMKSHKCKLYETYFREFDLVQINLSVSIFAYFFTFRPLGFDADIEMSHPD